MQLILHLSLVLDNGIDDGMFFFSVEGWSDPPAFGGFLAPSHAPTSPRRLRRFERLPESNPFTANFCWYLCRYVEEILILKTEQNRPSDRQFDSVSGTIFTNIRRIAGATGAASAMRW